MTVATPPSNFDLEEWLDTHDTPRDVDAGTFLYFYFGPREAGDVIDEHERLLTSWVRDVEQKQDEVGEEAAIEHFVETSALSKRLGDPARTIPTRFSVQDVLHP